MSTAQRLGLVAAAVVVLVVAFVVAGPGGDDEAGRRPAADTATPPVTTTTPIEAAPGGDTTAAATTGPAKPPEPEFERIRIRGGRPVGGVERISVDRGDTVRLRVTADAADHVHVHGFDIVRDVGPGRPARFVFEADADGVFEIELEGFHVQIAELEVSPP